MSVLIDLLPGLPPPTYYRNCTIQDRNRFQKGVSLKRQNEKERLAMDQMPSWQLICKRGPNEVNTIDR